jgi:cation diffusion facilitator CzcD-associated flavoprotein CzcO
MLWTVITEDVNTKQRTRWTANVVIHATGLFNRGKIPAIPGASKFKGQSWHTVDWPKDADIAGKRVAVIGTGPSSAQVIPAIQPLVKSLTVYQRGPTYCLPRVDYAYTRLHRFLFNYIPLVHLFYCLYLYYYSEIYSFKAFRPGNKIAKSMDEAGIKHLEAQVKDPVLRQKLRPSGRFGCKRAFFLDDYYPALQQPNVELITDPPVEIDESGIISKPVRLVSQAEKNKIKHESDATNSDAVIVEALDLDTYEASPTSSSEEKHTEVDVLIWGTGFVVQEWGTVYEIRGRGGKTLGEHWGQDCLTLYGSCHQLQI